MSPSPPSKLDSRRLPRSAEEFCRQWVRSIGDWDEDNDTEIPNTILPGLARLRAWEAKNKPAA